MLDYAKSKYNIPSDAEPWVIDTIGEAWKQFKKRIKKYHYTPYNSFREMMKNCPMTVPELHFRKLVQFWRLDIIKVSYFHNSLGFNDGIVYLTNSI
ncbi:hypothetical protein HN51_001680 [Arachis hypogaea]